MADEDKKKKLAAWSEPLGTAASNAGVSKEMVRKALALNPGIRSAMTSTDILKQLKEGNSQRAEKDVAAAKQVSPAPTSSIGQDILQLIAKLRATHQSDLQQLAAEELALKKKREQLKDRTLQTAIQIVIDVDPNMMSPRTMVVLEDEKAFLKEIGFDARKVVERQKSGK